MYVIENINYGGADWHDDRTVFSFITKNESEFGYDTKEEAIAKLRSHILELFTNDVRTHADTDKIMPILNLIGIPQKFGKSPSYTCPVDTCYRESDYVIKSRIARAGRAINKSLRAKGYSAKQAYITTGKILDERFANAYEYQYKFPNEFIDNNGKVTHENEVTLSINEKGELIIVNDYMWGQVSYKSTYVINEVKNPVYAVIENFLSPSKYYDCIERLWHEPFATYKEAITYKASFVPHEDWDTDVYIACLDLDEINKDWYNAQLNIITLLEQNCLDIYDSTFSPWTTEHEKRINALLGQA